MQDLQYDLVLPRQLFRQAEHLAIGQPPTHLLLSPAQCFQAPYHLPHAYVGGRHCGAGWFSAWCEPDKPDKGRAGKKEFKVLTITADGACLHRALSSSACRSVRGYHVAGFRLGVNKVRNRQGSQACYIFLHFSPSVFQLDHTVVGVRYLLGLFARAGACDCIFSL